jgi:uncharacterized protein YfaS (alpha-2-macroglobulin family)
MSGDASLHFDPVTPTGSDVRSRPATPQTPLVARHCSEENHQNGVTSNPQQINRSESAQIPPTPTLFSRFNRLSSPLLALCLLTATAPVLCQEEERPYFALNSSETFAPGQKPSITLTTSNLPDLAFRVYRINDPFKFFENLEDPHMFGGQAQRPPQEKTLIERFHTWKRNLRDDIRWGIRNQFTDDAWKDVHNWRSRPVDNRSHGPTTFATAPVLNPQQLVATWQTHIGATGTWHTETVPVEVTQPGVYLVEATRDELRAFTILMVSEIGIISKTATGHVAGVVARRSTGEPIPNCDILLWASKDNKTRLKTNADGIFDEHITAPQGSEPQPLVLARIGNSFAASSLAGYSLTNHFDEYSGYAYTDRPVYRPGHAVAFKGILRVKQGNLNRIPTLKNVSVDVTGPEDKKVYQKSLDFDPFGAVAGDFTLPKDTPLGTYWVNMHIGERQVGGSFEVQEYKKPEYEVRVTPAKPRVLQGDDVSITLDAKYFFGEPVAGAKVEYVVHRARYWDWSYYGEPDDDAPQQMQDNQGDTDEQVLDETAKLDANGKLEIKIGTVMDEHGFDLRYRIEARVTDAGNREITGTSFVLATYGTFRLRIDPEKWFVSPGAAASFNVSATDYDNHPINTPVTVELMKWSWRDNDRSVIATASGQTDAQGTTRVKLTIPPEGGGFEVRVKARTPEGRQVVSTTWLFSGGEDWGLNASGEHRVQLVPDQKKYSPGDTAHILIITGVKHARVLFGIEGASLSQLRMIEAKGPSVTVDVPITSESAPDIFVSASFFSDNEFYNGTKMVKVPPNDRKLAVEIRSSKPQYTPGEGAQFTVDAKDAAGKPVTAELSLGVVDEAIYGIKPDTTPDGIQVFYGTQYNLVQTDSSLNYYFHGEAGKRRMQLAALRPHRSFAAIKPDHLVIPKVRKAFPDTTLWLPRLMTDANGHAVANFTFPDSITAWRATARAITSDTKVGGAVLKTIVRKNVIVRLVLPRFFTMGDEVTISAIAHNYLASSKQAKMTLEVKGLELIDPGPREVIIDSRGEVKSDWRVRATSPGQAVITGAVLTDEESDAMELPIPVNPYGVKLTEGRSGAVANSSAADVTLQFPAQTVPQSRAIEVTLSPSVAGAMFSALDYLTSFPYGCTEQTMSSFLPNVIVSRALKELNVSADVNQDQLADKLRFGLERLADFQHEDGGWGWWKTDESDVFMTAYVVGGLSQAKGAGIAVDNNSIQRGLKWLRVAYDHNPKMIADLKAYVVYAMSQAGTVDAQALEDVWSVHEKLSSNGAALLGLTFQKAKNNDRVATLVKQLEAAAKTDDSHAWWTAGRDYLMDYWFDLSPETTAMAVKLLSQAKPDSPLIPKAVLYLMAHRDGGYWYSTKQTAMVIFGLTDYLKQSGELKPNLQATVTVNGKQVLAKAFGPADALSPIAPEITIEAADLAAANKIHVESRGTGRLYWSVTERYFSTESKHVKEGSTDLNLLRDYYKLTPQKSTTASGEEILYSLDKVDGPLSVGDVLAVRLTVTGSSWRYLLVEDPIPAGAEFIARDDLYKLKDQPSWWHYYFDRRELHDDRMALFRSYFYRSQEQYFYLLKVVNPGKFRVSPARVEPMYQPRYLATTEGKEIEFK